MTADVFLTSRFGPARTVDLAKVAERAGFGGVWLAEHHFIQYGQCPSATILGGYVLSATQLRVGTAACVMSARNPIALAEEAGLLRSLAGDRFQLGVGRGGPGPENDLLGGGIDRYRDGFQAWLDELLACLCGEGPAPIVPAPGFARGPEPGGLAKDAAVGAVPVRVAATSLSSVELAARRGLPLLLGWEKTVAEIAVLRDRWSELAGYESPDHARVLLAYPRRNRQVAEAELRQRLPQWLRQIGDPGRDLRGPVEHLVGTHAIGSVEQVRAALAEPVVPHLLLLVEAAGSPEAAADLIESVAGLMG